MPKWFNENGVLRIKLKDLKLPVGVRVTEETLMDIGYKNIDLENQPHILINNSGRIIDGVRRVNTAAKFGMDSLPCRLFTESQV